MESKVSGHWTDGQLIEYLYGLSQQDDHFPGCAHCQARVAWMQANRQAVELNHASQDDVSYDLLAAQRRKIYARLTQPMRWWSPAQFPRWASAAATIIVLGGGLLVYEQKHAQVSADKVSDAQLAQEVSSMAQDSEPQATAPLQELFDE